MHGTLQLWAAGCVLGPLLRAPGGAALPCHPQGSLQRCRGCPELLSFVLWLGLLICRSADSGDVHAQPLYREPFIALEGNKGL